MQNEYGYTKVVDVNETEDQAEAKIRAALDQLKGSTEAKCNNPKHPWNGKRIGWGERKLRRVVRDDGTVELTVTWKYNIT